MTTEAIIKGVRSGTLTPSQANELLHPRYEVKKINGVYCLFPRGSRL